MNNTSREMKRSASCRRGHGKSGQALVEMTLVTLVLISLVFGLIDFSRAIYERQLLVNLTREAANLAARGTGSTQLEVMQNAVNAVTGSASPLNLTSTNGLLIVSAVTNANATSPYVSQQVSTGRLVAVSSVGKKGSGIRAVLPVQNPSIAQTNHTLYIAEIWYVFKPVTPIGKLVNFTFSNRFYDVAYFPGG